MLLLLLLLAVAATAPSAAAAPAVDSPADAGDTPVHRFQQYLRIRTAHPNPDYAGAVAFLAAEARRIGLQTRTLEFAAGKPLLLLTWPGRLPSLPSLLLNSHLDSVPADAPYWSSPPFAAHLDPLTRRIYARGAQDDKSISVQYLEAIHNLKAAGFAPARTVHLSFVPDEEIGGADGSAKFAASAEFEGLGVGFVLDEGQANPGDEFRVFYADRSPWWLTVRAVGAPGHGSRLYDGAAMENLAETMEVVARFRKAQFDRLKAGEMAASEVVSVNPVYLKAGTPSPTGFVMNMQPSEAEAGFDIRLPPTEDPALLSMRVSNEWAPSSRNMTFQLTQKGPIRDYQGRPLMTATDDSNPWWTVFKQAIIDAGGKLAKPEILASTTDARFMRLRGIPTLGFSPMTSTPILLHDHNEFLEESVFLRGIKLTQKGPIRDYQGRPLMTATDDSNPWWTVFKQAIIDAGEKLAKPEILASTTDARFMRLKGIPTLGFSPMTSTPILLHDHNEFLEESVFLRGIKVYESVISALSNFTG